MLPLSAADQRLLLRLARSRLEEKILRQTPLTGDIPESLKRRCGAFVSLHRAGALRGCVGRIASSHPLDQTICECALSAALNDSRFSPVRADEVPELHIEISVLSPLVDTRPDQIEVGKHGIVISQGDHLGLLLPQVAAERNWDHFQFLDETCLKAGLAKDAWRRGARIQAFTAQVFAEGTRPPDE